LSLRKKIAFSLIAVVLFFGFFELMMRVAGFRFDTTVEQMEFSFPLDDYNQNAPQKYLQQDDALFWKPIAGVLGHDAKGFYGPEFSAKKPEGVFRIVCLGDSCTHFGPISYPDILRDFLEREAPGRFEVINAACIGYTSFQGRTLLEQQVLDWSPDLVTVYFGWNDHWLARGVEDKNQAVAQPSTATRWLNRLRLMQLARMLSSGSQDRQIDVMRVSTDDYADNLMTIAQKCNESEAMVWYITAPHALDLGIPPYLYSSGEISNPDDLIPLHRQYNQIVADVAQQQQASLIDLQAEIDQMDKSNLFIDDHIHLSPQGKLYLTRRMIDQMKQQGLLPAGESSSPAAETR